VATVRGKWVSSRSRHVISERPRLRATFTRSLRSFRRGAFFFECDLLVSAALAVALSRARRPLPDNGSRDRGRRAFEAFERSRKIDRSTEKIYRGSSGSRARRRRPSCF
jgi:hypothetical protein